MAVYPTDCLPSFCNGKGRWQILTSIERNGRVWIFFVDGASQIWPPPEKHLPYLGLGTFIPGGYMGPHRALTSLKSR